MNVIRIERRDNKTYAFIKVVNGDSANAKEIVLSPKQREAIEAILNSEIEEHDIVVVTKDNDMVKVGEKGTVVHIYESGKAYEVEFTKKKIVLTMYHNELKKHIK